MAKSRVNGKRGILPVYKSYMFRNKDPVIDSLRTIIQDEFKGLNRHTLKEVKELGGPSTACMHSWFFGKTKRPTNATIEAAGRAVGWHREWVKGKGK